VTQEATGESREKLIVVTVHGIRTFGEWQQRLERLIKARGPDAEVHNYQYGFFSVLAFILPPLRAIRVWFFRRSLKRIIDRNPSARVTIIGHSFGTHMIGRALARGFPSPARPIEQVILAASVLRQDFDWERLVDDGIVSRIINDCGTDDAVLILSQFCVLFTGMAGRVGFSGLSGVTLFNRYHRGGHSHYFISPDGSPSDGFMEKYWLPLIFDPGPPLEGALRPALTPARGAVHFLLQNADGLKIALLAVASFLLWQKLYDEPRREAKIERLGKLRVVALQQVGNDETVAEGVATLLAISLQDPEERQGLDVARRWLPELRDLRTQLQLRGSPTLVRWGGENLLLTGKGTIILPGNAVESFWFSRDRKLLITYDSESSIMVYDSVDGRRLLTIPSKGGVYPNYSYDAEGNEIEPEPMKPFDGGMGRLSFNESSDGRTIFGFGMSADPGTVADQRPLLLMLDRSSLAYSLCVFPASLVRVHNDAKGVNAFAGDRRGKWFEIAPPKPDVRCGYRTTDAEGEPVEVSPEFSVRLAALPDISDVDLATADPTLEFPALRNANESWSKYPRPEGGGTLGFNNGIDFRGTRPLNNREVKAQLDAIRNYVRVGSYNNAKDIDFLLSSDGFSRAITFSEADDSLISVLDGGGNSYMTNHFCVSRKVGDPIRYCDGINAHGNFVSFAVSRDNRYVAGGDLAALGRPGLTIFDARQHKELALDRQPEGGTNAVAFDTSGDWAFAATPYGIWAYALGNGRAQLQQIFKVSGLLSNSDSSSIEASIAVGRENLFYLSEGLLQAISRKTGEVVWLEKLPIIGGTGGALIYDQPSDQLAVNDDRCVYLLHGATGARIMRPLCTNEEYAPATGIDGLITGIRFSPSHQLEVWTDTAIYRRDRQEQLRLRSPLSRSWINRILAWIGIIDTELDEVQARDWTMRTGHQVTMLPARPVRMLESN